MKKLILSAAMIAGLGMFAANAAAAADGTITFNGEITAVTCSIHGGTAAGGNNFIVTLPTVQTTAFSGGVGTSAGATPYNIYVGESGETGCTNGTLVSVHYEPSSPRVDPTTGFLALDPGAGVATGVQLQLLNQDRSTINLATNPESAKYTIAGNTATLPFFAQYVSTSDEVTAGPANSSVMYSVAFN
jgi:major type 1 subunit fimbrin (pilin)